jgi:hypothetical protein
MSRRSGIVRPSIGWFFLLDGGLVALAVLAASERAHKSADEALPSALPPRAALQRLFAGAIITHLFEAMVARRMARKRGLRSGAWTRQTLVVGFPSILKLRRIPKV